MNTFFLSAFYVLLALPVFSFNRFEITDTIKPIDSTFLRWMEPIEIKAVRANRSYPFTTSYISKRSIEKNNLGQDIPFLLSQVPGVVANSDAGNGIGYTGIRIRGTDASRINFTLNGISYNDAESQGVFLVNLPDFLSSVSDIQVQRGVGTSSNGPGAFGATINLFTNEVQDTAYAQLSNSIGSFRTLKNTIKFGTGLMKNQFTVDGRLSSIQSDGYVDRAKSRLQSFYISAASLRQNSSLRFNIFSGDEKTYQAWYGVSEEQLKTNRRFNSAGTEKPGNPYENETDNYTQTHYQLFYNKRINTNWNFSSAVFATTGKGYYEQYKAEAAFKNYGIAPPIINGTPIENTDLIRQLWLDNIYKGTNASIQYTSANREIVAGGGISQYDGQHMGKIIWANIGIENGKKWYDLDADKSEQHVFVKWLESMGKFKFFGDLQIRNVNYALGGFRNNPSLLIDQSWFFVNPKWGIRYTNGRTTAFASFAAANKEPNRDDFEAGTKELPKAEQLSDWELGIEQSSNSVRLNATLYYMRYRNQLVLTGKVNDVGAYTRTNVQRSYRMGLELEATVNLSSQWSIYHNLTLSNNRIIDHTEFWDDYDAGGQQSLFLPSAPLSFSPAVTSSNTIVYKPIKNSELKLSTRYVSRQFMDNTGRKDRSLDPFFVQDLQWNHTIQPKRLKSLELILQMNNIWNALYAPNGYTYSYFYSGELIRNNFYYPMAERNFMAGISITL